MEMFWATFIIIMGNILINAMVLNSQIKHTKVLDAFVKAAGTYATAYNMAVTKYNEVAEAFNEMRKVSDVQADMLETILAMIAQGNASPAPLEGAKVPRRKKARSNGELPSSRSILDLGRSK